MRALFGYLGLLVMVLAGAMPAQAADPEQPLLTVTVSSRSMNDVIAALDRAVVNHNFTFVRQQAIDSRLVPYAQEVRSVRVYYFCNFARMNQALKLDTRTAQLMPCRITLVETASGVDLIAINPAWVMQYTDNPSLYAECQSLKQDYLAILEEVLM